MAMPWFKFYGQDFLVDPKLILLPPVDKYLFVVLLCLANNADKDGFIPNLTEETLLEIAHVEPSSETEGILQLFQNIGMITFDNVGVTLLNFDKRQNKALTPYERVKRSREKKKIEKSLGTNDNISLSHDNVDNVDDNPLDEIRLDKDKIKIRNISVYDTLEKITETDMEEIASSYKVGLGFVKLQYEKLANYCASSGKTYRNYKAALRNFILRDMQKAIEHPHKGGVVDATNI